jgi:membrane-associated phospholipid phosphatase
MDQNIPDLRFRIVRLLVGISVGLSLAIGYMFISGWNTYRFDVLGVPTLQPVTVWDAWVPFVPQAVWLYTLYYLIVLLPVGLVRNYRELSQLFVAYLVTTWLGWAGFLLIPVRIVHPPFDCAGLACTLLNSFYNSDSGVNAFPSLHVGHSTLAACFYFAYGSRFRYLVALVAAGITVSTVLTAQHYVVDLPAGMLVGWFGWWVSDRLFRPRDPQPHEAVQNIEAALHRMRDAIRRIA